MHMIMWIMSDRAIPRSFRFMEGFGVHKFRLLDANNRSTFVNPASGYGGMAVLPMRYLGVGER